MCMCVVQVFITSARDMSRETAAVWVGGVVVDARVLFTVHTNNLESCDKINK